MLPLHALRVRRVRCFRRLSGEETGTKLERSVGVVGQALKQPAVCTINSDLAC